MNPSVSKRKMENGGLEMAIAQRIWNFIRRFRVEKLDDRPILNAVVLLLLILGVTFFSALTGSGLWSFYLLLIHNVLSLADVVIISIITAFMVGSTLILGLFAVGTMGRLYEFRKDVNGGSSE